jgi:2,3-bisphosphoglycerate-dependent phosphoglycerate mutase
MKIMTYKLILLRHGHSEWNAKNLFTGWVDVDLNDQGRTEAARGGELLVENDVLPDILYTSLLKRAINTANISLDKADRGWIPVKRDWRLNERHYGALQGKDKAQTLAEYGEEQFMEWRRSYDTPPPPLDDDSEFSQAHDPRYADLGDALPRTECLKDVLVRLLPYWESDIKADLKSGKTVLVTAHGNSLRALVKHLDGISDEAIAGLNIPTGIPLVYDLDEDFQPVKPGGTYLDPDAAAEAILAVACSKGQLLAVLDAGRVPGSGDQVGDLLRHRDAMVREALEVPAGQGNVHSGGGRLTPLGGRDGLEHAEVEIVDGRVRFQDVPRHLKVARFQQHGELVCDLLVQLRHALERSGHGFRNDGGGETEAGQLGEVPGKVAHPLQRGAHPQGPHDHPQVAGNRTLQRQDVDGPLVQAVLQEVDAGIRGDDVLGEIDVRHLEGGGGLVHGFADQAGDLHQLVTDLGELFLKNLAH